LPAPSTPADGGPAFILPATVEQVLLVASAFWTLAANRLFFGEALQGRDLSAPGTWGFLLALVVALMALHFLLLAPVSNRWTVKPVVAVAVVVAAVATYYMQRYRVYMDPSMMRNVLRTDPAEAGELLGWTLLPHLALYAGLPLLLLWRVRIVRRPWVRATALRLGAMVAAVVVLVGAVMAVFQPVASLMRNHKELRYLVTPGNVLWSVGAVLAKDARGAAEPRQPIGLDAAPGPSWATRTRPRIVVLVVGETARAANWGLSGYARQTTPSLAALPSVINFPDVTACGTNTETSVPCLFAPVGRRDYDEGRIRGSESLLHVAARAGVAVNWLDNQSGCKGVCEGLPTEQVSSLNPPGLCTEGRCLDEGLLAGLDERLAKAKGTQLWVMHMLGNHGPSYFRRYPPAFARFQPECQNDDLTACSQAQIVNSYDNALLYTDHVLASLVAKLQAQAGQVDSAMLFVSDHGESLGEKGLFLHGVPYAIAPDEQTHVPMVMWLSGGFEKSAQLAPACLRDVATRPAAHDHVFHTVLGLLDVQTALYEPTYDLTAGCRPGGAAQLARHP